MPEFEAIVDRWTAYFREQGIDAVGFGSVNLKRRSEGAGWRRSDTIREGHGSAGAHIQRVFTAEEILRGLPNEEALFATHWRLARGCRLEQALVERPQGGWEPVENRLVMTEGFGFNGSIDIPLAQVLQYLDGKRTVEQAVAKASPEIGIAKREAAAFRQTAGQTVRRLAELGFLDPE